MSVFIILCIPILIGMKNLPSKYVVWSGIPVEIKGLIIAYLCQYDNLDDIINALNALSMTNKELRFMIQKEYGNIEGFTTLVHRLADRFPDFTTQQIAKKFETPAAKQYIELAEKLVAAAYNQDVHTAQEILNKGADINAVLRMEDYQGSILQWALFVNPRFEMIKFLLDNGADPAMKIPYTVEGNAFYRKSLLDYIEEGFYGSIDTRIQKLLKNALLKSKQKQKEALLKQYSMSK
jgi:hypothetical protein